MRSPNYFYVMMYETICKRMTKSESGQLSDDCLKKRETLSNKSFKLIYLLPALSYKTLNTLQSTEDSFPVYCMAKMES